MERLQVRMMIKGGGERVVDWIWRLCNIAFERGVLEDLRSAVIFQCTRLTERGQNAATIKELAC